MNTGLVLLQGNRFMEVGGVAVVQVVRILRARLNLALNQLRPARRDIKAILAADPNSPQVVLQPHPLIISCSTLDHQP